MKVRLHASWCDDAEIREALNRSTPNGDHRWKEMELTLDDDYDWFVVFNHPTHDNFDPSRTVVFQSEPRISRRRIEFEHRSRLRGCRIVDTDRNFNLDKWYVHRSHRQLAASTEKTLLLSTIVSGMTWLPRHRQRLAFAQDVLPTVTDEFDHFGRNIPAGPNVRGEIADKAEALLPYRYTFNAENSVEVNYFTEKILDPILCECLCFYDGCPNIEAFIDPEAVIRVSMDRPDEAREIMREAIAHQEWEKRLPLIREQKRRLMHELNPLEIIRKVLLGEAVIWRTDEELDAAPAHEPVRGLPPVLVISLPDARERKARLTHHLRRLGVPFTFVDGVHGATLTSSEVDELVAQERLRRHIGREFTPGELGCALSHLEMMRRAALSSEPYTVVLEDDVRLCSTAAEAIRGVAAHTAPGDLVLLGATGGEPLRVGARATVAPGVVLSPAARGGIWGTHAYLVTKEAAQAIIQRFPRAETLADDWSLFGQVVNIRLLEPQCAWTRGPFEETSGIETQRAKAEAERTTAMHHSLVSRLSYKSRLVDAVHPRIGGRLVKFVDAVELTGAKVRGQRFRLATRRRGGTPLHPRSFR